MGKRRREAGIYWVRVRDRVMVAHSLRGELFGPARRRHGATFLVEVEFRGPALLPEGVLVDIGRARQLLAGILSEIDRTDLDEHPDFRERNSTSETVARWIFERLAAAVAEGRLGPGGDGITELAVEVAESDVAWAGFRAPLARRSEAVIHPTCGSEASERASSSSESVRSSSRPAKKSA